ncbi:MAG: SDR family NAD(P)-dependent oxidoreductase, partial [Acidobacteriota bacterium]
MFEGQVAVVTGGAQGIGGAVVDRFLEGGARVAIWDVDQTLAAKKAAKKAAKSDCVPVAVDIR